MKYNFDEIIDRINDPYSFSVKWSEGAINGFGREEKVYTEIPKDIICFELADMDFKVAPEIIDDLRKVTEHGIYGYSIAPKQYYQAVCDWFARRQNWHFAPEDITYFPGTHPVVAECVKRLTKPNEGVMVLTPCYGYHGDIDANGRRFISVQMKNDNNYYTIDWEAFEAAAKQPDTTLFVLCHPHNPTGRVFNEEELKRMYQICQENGVIILSDEVHSDLIRKGIKFHPIMELCGSKGIVAATAVNKTFNLAGLAMTNVIICDPELKERFGRYFALPSPFGIQAVISAYTKSEQWVDELNEYLDKNLEYFVNFFHEKLPKAKVILPEGSYITWVDFSGYGLDDETLDKKFIEKHLVIQAGNNFDALEKNQVVRFCLSSPLSVIKEGCARIYDMLEK